MKTNFSNGVALFFSRKGILLNGIITSFTSKNVNDKTRVANQSNFDEDHAVCSMAIRAYRYIF